MHKAQSDPNKPPHATFYTRAKVFQKNFKEVQKKLVENCVYSHTVNPASFHFHF